MAATDTPGAPCWIDLMTSDTDRAAAFYGALFGWEVEDPGPEYGGYKNFRKDGAGVAGLMGAQPDAGPPNIWSVYLATPDIEKTAALAAEHGGSVMVPPMAVAELGHMAVFFDAGGAAIGAWQPGDHRGFDLQGEPDSPGWFELFTRDWEASLDFYRDVFQWDVHKITEPPGFHYATHGEGEDGKAGIMDATEFLPEGAPAHWSVYFQVADADATIAKAVDLGGALVQGPDDTPYGRLASLTDPMGAVFKLVQR